LVIDQIPLEIGSFDTLSNIRPSFDLEIFFANIACTVCPADSWQQDNFANEEKQFCSLGEFGGFLPDKERCKKPYIPRLSAAFCCRQGQENATAAAAGAAVLEAAGLFCLRDACKKRRDGGEIQNSYGRLYIFRSTKRYHY
jgi:hypothetical protein